MNFILTHWVNPLTLQALVKNPDAQAVPAEIFRKSLFNCGI
jgi:hypothetical protein